MENNGKTMVLAAFAADSLALGVHWIYDTTQIFKTYGRVDGFLKPDPLSYHSTKDKGEFTHYGDQAMVLLESLAASGGFDLDDFSQKWRTLFEDYQGYIDQATRMTLSNYESGKTAENAGSFSDDLAGASRIASLVFCYHEDLDTLVHAARSQTRMTHNNPVTIDSAEFFARAGSLVLHGESPKEALKKVSADRFARTAIEGWVKAGMETHTMESVSAIAEFGQSCRTEEAFPGVIHLIAKYEDDLSEALIQAAMAGGDSAARGALTGLILGAQKGREGLPEKWLNELKKKDHIVELLEKLG